MSLDGNITSSTHPCVGVQSKLVAQTLFLGASVSSINLSKGWSGQTSQLTVNLIEDPTPPQCVAAGTTDSEYKQYLTANPPALTTTAASDTYMGDSDANTPAKDVPDFYHTCTGFNCYITSSGNATSGTYPGDYILPGKVFYEFITRPNVSQVCFSKFWKNADPGFFGVNNHIRTNGTYITTYDASNVSLNRPYDIIGTPVYFKLGDVSFGGIVQSWSRTLNSGGKGYSVVINGMESILSQCYIILNNFAGTIYSNISGSTGTVDEHWGGPRNYVGRDNVKYWDVISNGNIPNVFNVYGFLESMGAGGFGGANLNEEGIEANKIIDALCVLTSSSFTEPTASSIFNNTSADAMYKHFGKKSAFSPFGRIVVKCMQEQDTYEPITPAFARFGVIPPTLLKASNNTKSFCQFVLDLSELPLLPKDYRISGPVISILDLINQVTEESGFDYHITMYPLSYTYAVSGGAPGQTNTETLNVIKVHTIPRLAQPRPNIVSNTVKQLQCLGYAVSSVTNGQEANETQSRNMLIGGKQQRLYQAKSLRLAYSQSSYILNPTTNKFIDYMKLGDNNSKTRIAQGSKPYHHGKIRVPSPLSVRNIDLSTNQNPGYSGLYSVENSMRNLIFSQQWTTTDSDWGDNSELASNQSGVLSGDYNLSKKIIQQDTPPLTDAAGREPISPSLLRFYPIYYDVICPFFGFVSDNEYTIDATAANNDFKRIRPVYYDTWTGQIVIVLRVHELPVTNLDLQGFYAIKGIDSFILTENEIRAALAGFDNFLVYSLAKTYKNDLIEMVRRAYEDHYTAQYTALGFAATEARDRAKDKTDWYWRLIGGNIAGIYDQPDVASPDKGDGSASIEEEVMQDLHILHGFISKIGEFYGKKYMVSAPSLRAYRDDQFLDVVLPTSAGPAYVFSGGGKLHFNYEPTNDGAWEEYGNLIDDTISVGSNDWYNLTDDSGKIKPLVAYNVNDQFDYVRYNTCKLTQSKLQDYINSAKNDPFWNFEGYEYIQSLRAGSCGDEKFMFPGLNLSSLGSTDYIIKDVKPMSNWATLGIYYGPPGSASFTFTTGNTVVRDAWGKLLPGSLKKIYLNTSVEEGFCFLDPIKLVDPKIIIDAPGLTINSTAETKVKDPNRTVISNVAVEDLSIYLHAVPSGNWDPEWIRYMCYYISDIHKDTGGVIDTESDMIGSYAASANQSANFVDIAPKAAHPFFVGIPIKYNHASYGPWVNYPYADKDNIFPSGISITQSSTFPLTCSGTGVVIDSTKQAKALDNWILPTKVDVDESLVPWNYGGMSSLDRVAYQQIENNLNYQSVIETAQIDMPGLPIFGLGLGFNTNTIGITGLSLMLDTIAYVDVKDTINENLYGPVTSFALGYSNLTPTTGSNTLTYKTFSLSGWNHNYTEGPIVTNIQTSIGEQGIVSTYSFRTYTPKVGLFNRQNIDRIKKANQLNMKRSKQLAKIDQQSQNINDVQSRFLQEKKFENATLASDYSSKLFGWSPSTVLIGQANPYIRYPDRQTPYLEPTGLFSAVTGLDTRSMPSPASNPFTFTSNGDIGVTGVLDVSYLTDDLSALTLMGASRYHTSVGMYELKEVEAQIKKDKGLQSVMSLDGIFSPVSFYPTLKNSTYHYGLYDTISCPFCKNTKTLTTNYTFRIAAGNSVFYSGIQFFCDKCGRINENGISSLKGTLTTTAGNQSIETLPPYIISSGTDLNTLMEFKSLAGSSAATAAASSSSSSNTSSSISIPINLVTLNPIVVPYGNLSNSNVQNYTGVYPGSKHPNVSDISPWSSSGVRQFVDRCRHSIEIVGRGATKPHSLSIHNNLTEIKDGHQVDFFSYDILLNKKLGLTSTTPSGYLLPNGVNSSFRYQMNHRFLGLRGPLTMHGWGYDLEGYPVPNAADEPYQTDKYNRPRRFKIKVKDNYPKTVKYKSLNDGDLFIFPTGTSNEFIKNNKVQASGLTDTSDVDFYIYEDDLTNTGGYYDTATSASSRTTGYQGSIISKTQYWTDSAGNVVYDPAVGTSGGKWSQKKKLKEFYLNWAERPDLWPVGPVDLRWDAGRKVWTMKSSDAATIYKMVYVTLEEDLKGDQGMDESYPARGFLDDLQYGTEPVASGYRRLVFVKDRAGYTAPRGAKLLCRYDKDSGFYEAVSKPTYIVKGTIAAGSNTATLEMSYAQGIKAGESYPTMMANFENPFNLPTQAGNGLFTYINGKWTLTTASN